MKQKMIFSTHVIIDKKYYPTPASGLIPDWYKKMESYLGQKKIPDGDGNTSVTIKKCMPVFDAITAGYILYTPVDLYVSQRDGFPYYEWSDLELVSFHSKEQAPTHPNVNELLSIPKFRNLWSIKTPKGYSTLFVQPFHRESPFTILPGVVDTDTYLAPVNFPFTLNDTRFEGFIPAGTPMAQVIPFKREIWEMSIGDEEASKEANEVAIKLKSKFFDRYKTMFWHKKEYR